MAWDMVQIAFNKFTPSTVEAGLTTFVEITGEGEGFVQGMQGVLIFEGGMPDKKHVIPCANIEMIKGTFEFKCQISTFLAAVGSYSLVLWFGSGANVEYTVSPKALTIGKSSAKNNKE
jgi:hypothetical protein